MQRVEDPHHLRGYRELRSTGEMRKLWRDDHPDNIQATHGGATKRRHQGERTDDGPITSTEIERSGHWLVFAALQLHLGSESQCSSVGGTTNNGPNLRS